MYIRRLCIEYRCIVYILLIFSVFVKDLRVETQGRGLGVKLQGQGQELGPALIQTCYGTEQEVMSLIVYCRCHVTDKQLSTWTYVTVMVYLR